MTTLKNQAQGETKDFYRPHYRSDYRGTQSKHRLGYALASKRVKAASKYFNQNSYSGIPILSLWLPIETGMLSSCFRKRVRANTNVLKIFFLQNFPTPFFKNMSL